ncbi:MAG: signal peptidase I [Planctomycetota bacterium]
MGTKKSLLKRIEKLIFWIVFLVGIVVLLKWQVVTGYSIPTSSMEPTIIGNPDNGDKVAVFKLQYALAEPERHDLVVFFKEGESAYKPGLFERAGGTCYVKRLVGQPGETLLVQDGDIYLGTSPQRLDAKSLETIESMLIPLYQARFSAMFFNEWKEYSRGSDNYFSLKDGKLFCDTSSATGDTEAELIFNPNRDVVRDGYLTAEGREVQGENVVNDLALHLEFELIEDGGELYGELREGADTFRFVLRSIKAGGGGELIQQAGQVVAKTVPIARSPFSDLTKGKKHTLSFMNIDNQIFLVLDGDRLGKLVYRENTDLHNPARNNLPLFGTKGAKIIFHDVRIDRDVYYTNDRGQYGVTKPYTIPAEHYFFLGDNSAKSEDSRSFGPISKEDLVGRPIMIYYPFSRIRWL